jgi:hypothetical protein
MLAGRRGRFTVRALMVATALVALAAWGFVLWGRSAQYACKAEDYLDRMNICKNNIAKESHYPKRADPSAPLPDWRKAKVEFFQIRADHAERLYRKYRRAAMFPWLTLEADPPEPSGGAIDGTL